VDLEILLSPVIPAS